MDEVGLRNSRIDSHIDFVILNYRNDRFLAPFKISHGLRLLKIELTGSIANKNFEKNISHWDEPTAFEDQKFLV